MAHEILLFVLFTLVVWMMVLAFFVKESDPEALTAFAEVAKCGKGLIALGVAAVLGYFLFIGNQSAQPQMTVVRSSGTGSLIPPGIPGMGVYNGRV